MLKVRGLPFIFREWASLMLPFKNRRVYLKFRLCRYTYSERFDLQTLFMLFTVTQKMYLFQKIEVTQKNFCAIIFNNF